MAADEAGLLDEVGRLNGRRAEAKVRDGLRAGLLRVVHEITLGVQPVVRAQDLDGVLVRADRPVRAEAEEYRADSVRRLNVQRPVIRQAPAAHLVGYPHGEPRPA